MDLTLQISLFAKIYLEAQSQHSSNFLGHSQISLERPQMWAAWLALSLLRMNKGILCFLVSASGRDDQRMEIVRNRQWNTRRSRSGTSGGGFKSQLWHLLVGSPQVSLLTQTHFLFCKIKDIEHTRMSHFRIKVTIYVILLYIYFSISLRIFSIPYFSVHGNFI